MREQLLQICRLLSKHPLHLFPCLQLLSLHVLRSFHCSGYDRETLSSAFQHGWAKNRTSLSWRSLTKNRTTMLQGQKLRRLDCSVSFNVALDPTCYCSDSQSQIIFHYYMAKSLAGRWSLHLLTSLRLCWSKLEDGLLTLVWIGFLQYPKEHCWKYWSRPKTFSLSPSIVHEFSHVACIAPLAHFLEAIIYWSLFFLFQYMQAAV